MKKTVPTLAIAEWGKKAWYCCPALFLWIFLVRHLSIEWRFNPQYRYAWGVPFLCVWLAYANRSRQEPSTDRSPAADRLRSGVAILIAAAYIPIHLVEEANPDWRLVSWALALIVVAETLLLVALVCAPRFLAGPVFLFLTAVPWPTCVERPVVRALTEVMTRSAVELLQIAGLPCISRGHVIEVGAGMVGIEEACSGIRSVQASCMLAVFFGLLYRWSRFRLVGCLGAALVFAFLSNLLRTVSLAIVAGQSGSAGMLRWHDTIGTVSALGCFTGVWAVAALGRSRTDASHCLTSKQGAGLSCGPGPRQAWSKLPIALVSLLVLGELVTALWYGFQEKQLPPPVTWHIDLPREEEQFREIPMSDDSRRMLRFDTGQNVAWTDRNGLRWQAIFLSWRPGAAAGRLARNHTPGDCLPAIGASLLAQDEPKTFCVAGLELPFRTYTARTDQGLVYVYFCLWGDRSLDRGFAPCDSTLAVRLRAVLEATRNAGQRSLELAVWNAVSQTEADKAMQSLLRSMIVRDA